MIALDLLPMAADAGRRVHPGRLHARTRCWRGWKRSSAAPRSTLYCRDMAPNMSGIAVGDQARIDASGGTGARVCRRAALKPGGDLLVKVFQGAGFEELRRADAAGVSKPVAVRKPKASRDRSAEVYLLGTARRCRCVVRLS
ncbi:MAG: hypothetical protein MZW92_79265 [Comamonadaceae bacterium]|nr:hypothetical protein [Comamonadaceae bacterium]